MRLSDMWWQHMHADAPPVLASAACPHITLLSRWSSTTSGSARVTVQDWLCATCHQVFTAETGDALREPATGAAARKPEQPPSAS